MMTPLLIVAIVVLPWLIALALNRAGSSLIQPNAAAIAGAVAAFLFFALGHFVQTDEMTRLLPDFVPLRRALVYATGVLEIAIAVALSIERTRRFGALAAMAVLVLFFPANVYGAVQAVEFGGHAMGPSYLAIRLPLQVFLFVWVYRFCWRAPLAQDRTANQAA